MDNENKNEELLNESPAVGEESLPDVAQATAPDDEQTNDADEQAADSPAVGEPEQERSVEDQTVERLSEMGDEISAEDLGGIPVTPPDDDDADASVEAEPCVMCGEKPADKSFGEDYDLCADCRKLLVKAPISFASVIFLILMVGAGMLGLMLSASQALTLQAASDAYDYAGKNQLYSAIRTISQSGSIGWKTARNAVSLYNDSGYLSGIKSTVESYFYDKNASADTRLTWADKVGKANLNAPWNKKVKQIYDNYNKAMEAYEKYYAYFSEYDENLYYGSITIDDVPYDELIQKLENAKKDEKATEGLAFISYCEWYLADMCDKGSETELQYMKAVKEARPDYTWLYMTQLTKLLIDNGDYEAAEANCAQMIEINTDDYYGVYYRAMILRRQGKYDEAIALMDEIIDDYQNNGFYYAYYEAGVNAFLKGDYKKAAEYIKTCFDGEYLNFKTANFYALLCKLNQDEDGYQDVLMVLSNNGSALSPTVDQFLNKQITAEELFRDSEDPFEQPAVEQTAAESEKVQ